MKYSPEELKYQSGRFFDIDLDAKDRPISQRAKVRTLNSLRIWLGITNDEWREYCSLSEYENVVDEIKTRLQIWLEEKLLYDHKPVGAIFALKAQFGWNDNPQVNPNVNNYVYVFGNEKNQLINQGKAILDVSGKTKAIESKTIESNSIEMEPIINQKKGRPLGSKASKKFKRRRIK